MMGATPDEARAVLQPIIDRANERRHRHMEWARINKANGRGFVATCVAHARRANREAVMMRRELRRLEAES